MTSEVRYSVQDEAVVRQDGAGAIVARGPGITTLMARAMGKAATSQFIVIERAADAAFGHPAPANFIDEHVFRKLRSVNVEPFPVSDDRTFLRRVYLDTVGVLPTTAEADRFLASADPGKRAVLIDELLDRDEYSTHWLVKFEDWFRNSQYYSQGRTNGSFKRWLHDLDSRGLGVRQDGARDAHGNR